MSFNSDIEEEIAAVMRAVDEITRVVAIEYFSGVIFRTPVGNPELWQQPGSAPAGYTGGRARSNWFLTFTVPSPRQTEDTRRGDDSQQNIRSDIAQRVNAAPRADNFYLTNNLPYIERLDENWSQQTNGLGIIAPEFSRVTGLISRIENTAYRRYGVDY